ncbi:MAG: NADH-quinone oxidoreductase subunit G [Anaerolineae bacterium]
MANVNVTIDGITTSVPSGITVLAAARLMSVDIPTLCDHPAIKPIGACRMCLVEIEKQRVLQPACTFPVSEGMVVRTATPATSDARKFVLQLLFSERNHFCMFCQVSGSCELQSQAYKHGLDHWRYDRAFPVLPVDASRKYFVMDHNRCILCRRCIRTCDELVGNATLGLNHRGAQTMIIADMDVPFGESSCVSCGTCLQVCPTGALMDRASAYLGATAEINRVKTTCTACSIGCGAELIVRDNRVIRVEGDWDAEPNHGLLCEMGRFWLLHEKRHRVTKPMIKGPNGWQETSWENATQLVADRLNKTGASACTVVSGFATNESAQVITARFPGTKQLMEGEATQLSTQPHSQLDAADLYIVVNTDLARQYPVASFAVKRGVHLRGSRLLLVDDQKNGMEPWAMRQVKTSEYDALLPLAQGAQTPVVVFDPQGEAIAKQILLAVPGAQAVALAPSGNTVGITNAGVTESFAPKSYASYYILAGEAKSAPQALLDACKTADFVAVQSSFCEPWMDLAQVILPTPTIFEKAGTVTNFEGKVGTLNIGTKSTNPTETEILTRIASLIK